MQPNSVSPDLGYMFFTVEQFIRSDFSALKRERWERKACWTKPRPWRAQNVYRESVAGNLTDMIY